MRPLSFIAFASTTPDDKSSSQRRGCPEGDGAEAVRVSHQRRLALGCGRMRSSVSVPSGLTTAPLLSDSSRTGAPRIVTAVADEARVPRWRDRRRAAVVRSSSTRASGSRGAAARGRAGLRPIRARTPWTPAVGRFPRRRVAWRCGRRHDVAQVCVGHRRAAPEGRPRRFQSTGSVSESSSGSEPIRPVPGIGSPAMQPRVWRRRQVRGRNRVQTVRSVSPSTTTPD